MAIILPLWSIIICVWLGNAVFERISFKVDPWKKVFYAIPLGFILATSLIYFLSLMVGFRNGLALGQLCIAVFLTLNFVRHRKPFKFSGLGFLFRDKFLFVLLILIGGISWVLFDTHVIKEINGDLYVGESTYGDLPFHLGIISELAYGNNFPPENPIFKNIPLVYPYLSNLFSGVLVFEGMTLRDSIVLPGMILMLCIIVLVYDFLLVVSKKRAVSFVASVLYFFNGGMGFYFFLKTYKFDLSNIIIALRNPTSMIEYSHVFNENIQWANFLSRMIVPERSLIFGIPVGILILRLLFFRDSKKAISNFELILAAFLLSMMVLLHTHTVLSLAIILPILALYRLKEGGNTALNVRRYLLLGILTGILLIPHIPQFLDHVGKTQGFFKFHLWWMKKPEESLIWFWFKNTYLYLPIAVICLILPKKIVNWDVRILQICGFGLFIIMNLVLFSPFDWDNVKFLFWAGLFFALAGAIVISYLLRGNILAKILGIFIFITMISSASLSLLREVNLKFVVFSKDAVEASKAIRESTPEKAVFLTYRAHNSPAGSLAGRPVLMGYQGSLWVHGINYSQVEKDTAVMFAGGEEALAMFRKYKVSYVLLEPGTPEGLTIDRDFFSKYPLVFKNNSYSLYRID